MLGKILGQAARGFASLFGKTTPDPTSTGGWTALSGPYKGWTDANDIWKSRSVAELESIHNTMAVVYSCVRRLCIAAQDAPARVGRQTMVGWQDLDQHPLMELLAEPNPEMSYSDVIQHVVAHLQCAGDSYIWKWRGTGARAGRPLAVSELWPIPTSWVQRRIVNAAGALVGYQVWQGSRQQPINVLREDMIRIRFPDPADLTMGLGPLQAALRETQMEEERQDYQMEMLANVKTPGTIFHQPDGWDEDQKDEFRAAIVSGLGRGRRGKPLFMSGEGAKIEMPAPLSDLDWAGLTSLSETRICACFGVPPILVGLRAGLDRSTFSNYGEARGSFYQDTMAPLWSKLDADLTRGLLRDEREPDRTIQTYHDTSNVKGLQEDATATAQRATALFNGGLVSRNEAREMAGLDLLDGPEGDVFVLPMSMIEVGAQREAPPLDDGTGDE